MTAGDPGATDLAVAEPVLIKNAPAGTVEAEGAIARTAGSTPVVAESHPDPDALDERSVLDGPFTVRQLLRLDEALKVADSSTGLIFSVYVGELAEPVRDQAERLHGQLTEPDRSVLIAVSPNQRVLEIVTGGLAQRQLPDHACRLAALSMAAAFGGGDLAGGLVAGLAQLADKAAAKRSPSR